MRLPRSGKVRLTVKQLREYVNSIDEGDDSAIQKMDEDSLDSQVDSYLTQYESEAKKTKVEGRDFRSLVKRFLFEEEDDVDPLDLGDDSGDKSVPDAPKKKSVDDIDISSYVNSVIRLIENYDSLLEVRSTLARRARNFLADQYDSDVLERFDSIIRKEHGIVPGKTEDDVEREESTPPNAAFANGPSPAGAGPA